VNMDGADVVNWVDVVKISS